MRKQFGDFARFDVMPALAAHVSSNIDRLPPAKCAENDLGGWAPGAWRMTVAAN
jgi:hypothetical protein